MYIIDILCKTNVKNEIAIAPVKPNQTNHNQTNSPSKIN